MPFYAATLLDVRMVALQRSGPAVACGRRQSFAAAKAAAIVVI